MRNKCFMFSSKILLNYLLFIIFIILLIIITEILTNYNNFKLISKKIFKQWIIISTQKRLISSLIFCYYYFEQNRSKQCQIWKISLCQLLNLINVYMYCYLFEESKKWYEEEDIEIQISATNRFQVCSLNEI